MATVAACVPTRNRAHYLALALDSTLGQSRRPDLLVISDDASTDGTPQVVADYTARFQAAGVDVAYCRHDPPLGHEGNLRFCFRAAQADYVAMLHDDDLWCPDYLRCLTAVLDQHPEASFATCDWLTINADGTTNDDLTKANRIRQGHAFLAEGILSNWLWITAVSCPFHFIATVFRRDTLAGIGFVLPGSGLVCDYAMFTTLAVSGTRLWYVPEGLAKYRAHAEERASDHSADVAHHGRDWITALSERHRSGPHAGVLRRAAAYRQRDYVMELAHAGQRVAAIREAVRLAHDFGLSSLDSRILLYLPLVLAGADRLRAGRGRQPVRPFHGFGPGRSGGG